MSSPTAETLRTWLVSHLAALRSVDPRTIDVRERFSRYGLDSLGAGRLIAELAEHLGRPLSPTLVWELPTIEALAAHLTGAPAALAAPREVSRPSDASEPIAIVGMACRFPKAPDLEAYWRLLADGVDAITEVPKDRWDAVALFDADPTAPGKLTTRWGGFLDQIDQFDPQFFGISPREAIQMDPQQRLVLELAWEALEDAGIPPHGLKDSLTSVFMGAMWSDYTKVPGSGMDSVTQHTATGQDLSIIPARISYALGLRGPSMAINTACSSSLVAIHLARQSLLSGESTMALAGGVNLLITPHSTLAMSKFGAMAPDGRSKAFDARANGYVRGEGGGIVVLERLSRAIALGHPIHAVIRGSALNNDGFSNGLTAPSPKAQELVVRSACASAGIDPAQIQYVETHGTGTMLGDPIEAGALGMALGGARPPERPLVIGSVKTNIGHLESAAGIAGLIKVVLSLQHRQIPPTLHFQRPNPHIPFETLRLRVQATLGPWPEVDGSAVAGVSSFGFGGTNAHVILEGAPVDKVHLLPLSASSEDGLRERVLRLQALVSGDAPRPPLGEICAASAAYFASEQQRIALTVRSYDDLATSLSALLEGSPRAGTFSGTARAAGLRPVFVFAGQGSQWVGMGRNLLRDEPAFRASLQRIDRATWPHLGVSLIDVLAGNDGAWVEDTALVQPAIFAVQVALADLLRSWGIEPAVVVGQSMGEVAAACVAGCLDLDDAALIICARSRIVKRASGQGGMAAVELSLDNARRALTGREELLSVAVSTSPTSTVLSGDATALDSLIAELERENVFCRRVKVDYASHGPHMDPLHEELSAALEPVRPRRGSIPFFSTVTGAIEAGQQLDATYWWRNLREPVLFAPAVARLVEQGHATFLDVGPHALLVRAIEQCVAHAGREATVLATLRRDEDERAALRDTLGALFVRGANVTWSHVQPIEAPPPARLAALGLPAFDDAAARPSAEIEPALLMLSAHSEEALTERARKMAAFIEEHPDVKLADVGYTAGALRGHLEHRVAVVASTRAETITSLAAFASGETRPGVVPGRAAPGGSSGVVFVFPGQGSQWLGMGRQLLAEEPAFREALAACDEAIQREGGFSVLAELEADEARSRLGQIDIVQPVLFAVEVALAALWRAWGVDPDCVVGHSMGEVAAAHVAGILGLDDAAKVICRRSRLLRRVSGKGAMALVELTLPAAEKAILGREDRLSIAVSNGPRSTVISGDPAAIDEVLTALEQQGVFCKRVKVDVASHSPQMDPLRDELISALADIRPRAARLAMRSTVTGELLKGPECDASYWASNLRAPVLFSSATQRLLAGGNGLFVEISPHPILLPAVEENLRATNLEGAAIASLRRNADEARSMREALGALYARGHSLDWARLYPDLGRRVALPGYPWQRERFWPAPESGPRSRRVARSGDVEHPLLGPTLSLSLHPEEHVWEQWLSADALPYLRDHRVRGEAVFPAAGYVEMALAAGGELLGAGAIALEALSFERMLVLSADAERLVQVALTEEGSGLAKVAIASRADGEKEWTRHATGTLRRDADPAQSSEPPSRIQARCAMTVEAADHYAAMIARGLEYRARFQGLERLWIGESEALGQVRLPVDLSSDAGAYLVHPALLDACLQATFALLPRGSMEGTVVPVGIERARVHGRVPEQAWVHVRSVEGAGGFDLAILDEAGQVLVEIHALRLARLPGSTTTPEDAANDRVYAIAWQPMALPAAMPAGPRGAEPGAWLVLLDERGTGTAVAAALAARGEICVTARLGTSYWRENDQHWQIDSTRAADFNRLLVEAFGPQRPCRGVIHCASLDSAPWEDTTSETLAADIGRGSLIAVRMVQALLSLGARDTPRLVLVTRGAQTTRQSNEAISVAQTPLWGLGRTIALEHSELECTRIDLPIVPLAGEAELLVRELLDRDGEDQIALREEGRFAARLVRSSIEGAHESKSPAAAGASPGARSRGIMADATYLITGGVGGLGLSVASWMVSQGARYLALMGRSEPTAAAHEAIRAMMDAGAKVRVLRGDVTQAEDVERIFGQIRDDGPPLRGVVHAAGVLDDRTLVEMGESHFWAPIRPKALGAWNLHTATQGMPLDFFVMYSSIAAMLGSSSQAAYGAGNAFLDALAHARTAAGLPAMSIQWGPFAEVGLAAAQENRGQRMSGQGFASFTPDEGIAHFSRLLQRPRAEVGLLQISWRQWFEAHPQASGLRFLAELENEQGAPGGPKPGSFRATLDTASPADRTAMLQIHLLEQLGRVLRLDPSRIDRRAPFTRLGLDSLTSMELRNRLEASLGLQLSAAILFTHPIAAALTTHLLDAIYPPPAPLPALSASASADLDHLGADALLAMLDEELALERKKEKAT